MLLNNFHGITWVRNERKITEIFHSQGPLRRGGTEEPN